MKNLLNASAISGAEIFRDLPHLRELSSFISSHVLLGFFFVEFQIVLEMLPISCSNCIVCFIPCVLILLPSRRIIIKSCLSNSVYRSYVTMKN